MVYIYLIECLTRKILPLVLKKSNTLRNVYINQRDAQILTNSLYFSLNSSTCFGLSLVHHQEQHLISCTVQLVHLIKCCS